MASRSGPVHHGIHALAAPLPHHRPRLARPLSAQIRRAGRRRVPAGAVPRQAAGRPRPSGWNCRRPLGRPRPGAGGPPSASTTGPTWRCWPRPEGLAPWGLHLGQGDLPAAEARKLPGLGGLHLGASTHGPAEWEAPGPPPATTPGSARSGPPPPSPGTPRRWAWTGCARAARPCGRAAWRPVAIGGLTLADAPACFEAGAEALAMVGEVARAEDPGRVCSGAPSRSAGGCARRWPRAGGWCCWAAAGGANPPWAEPPGPAPGASRPGRGPAGGGRHRDHHRAASSPTMGEAGLPRPGGPRRCASASSPRRWWSWAAGAWEDPRNREAVQASGFSVLWLAEVPERAWARVGRDPSRPLAATREQFMARWARRTAAWSEAPMVLPLGRPPQVLAEAWFVAGLLKDSDRELLACDPWSIITALFPCPPRTWVPFHPDWATL